MVSVQAYSLGDLMKPRHNQMHGQECLAICIGKPPKTHASQIKASTKKLKVIEHTFHFAKNMPPNLQDVAFHVQPQLLFLAWHL